MDVKLYKAELAVDEVVAADALGGGKISRAGLAVAVAPSAASLGFADGDGLSLVDLLTDLSARPHEFLLKRRGDRQHEAVPVGEQALLVRSEAIPGDGSGKVTVRMTVVARQKNP